MVKQEGLLVAVTNVKVKSAKKFVAKDQLKAANIGFTGYNFDEFFLNMTEEGVKATNLKIHKLEKASLDGPIMEELGITDGKDIKLAHLFQLIEAQAKGNDGPLLTNGYANVAYIKGSDGKLWAVLCIWLSDGGDWDVRAYSVESPDRWSAGGQVISCD
jgi:hypothetical protein